MSKRKVLGPPPSDVAMRRLDQLLDQFYKPIKVGSEYLTISHDRSELHRWSPHQFNSDYYQLKQTVKTHLYYGRDTEGGFMRGEELAEWEKWSQEMIEAGYRLWRGES